MQHQFIALNCFAQLVFQREALHACGVQVLAVENEIVFSRGLGVVHRCIRCFQQALDGGSVPRRHGDTDTGRDHELVALNHHGLRKCVQ